MNLTPLNGYVVVDRQDKEDVSSGVVVSRSAEWMSEHGASLFVAVNVNDTVLFMEEDCLRVPSVCDRLFLVHSHDLLAKVNPEV